MMLPFNRAMGNSVKLFAIVLSAGKHGNLVSSLNSQGGTGQLLEARLHDVDKILHLAMCVTKQIIQEVYSSQWKG